MLDRTGESRTELLVVLLIVIVFVMVAAALVPPAVCRVREAAATSACQNNLRQLGRAAADYRDSNDRLPPLVDQGRGAPTGRGLPSVFTNLMPFIEATPVVFRPERSPDYYLAPSSVVFTYPHKGETFKQVGGMANQVMRLFLDPADVTASQLRDVPLMLPDGTTGHYATTSYAANGLVPWGIGAILQGLQAGTANTILFGERPQVCRTATGEEVYSLWGLGVYGAHMPAFAALTPAAPPGLWDTGQAAPIEPLPDESAADRDARIRVRFGREDATPAPPDFATPVQVLRGGWPCDPRLPGTPHRRGMQAVMVDGSVRQFGPETAPWVFWAACVPARLPIGP